MRRPEPVVLNAPARRIRTAHSARLAPRLPPGLPTPGLPRAKALFNVRV